MLEFFIVLGIILVACVAAAYAGIRFGVTNTVEYFFRGWTVASVDNIHDRDTLPDAPQDLH